MFSWGSSTDPEWKYDTVPTPQSKEEYETIANTALDNVLNIIYSDGWDKLSVINNVLIEEKPVSESDLTAVRTSTILNKYGKNKNSMNFFI